MTRSLLLATVLVPSLSALELPVIGVELLPDAAVVVREGTLQPGDRLLGGLPPGGLGEALVSVDGAPATGWRVLQLPMVGAGGEDALARATQAAAARQVGDRLERARLRGELAALVLPGDVAGGDGPPPLLPAESWTALTAFIAANRTQSSKQQRDALAAREALQREQPRRDDARQTRTIELAQDAATPRRVRVVLRHGQSGWTPSYRLRIDAGGTPQLERTALLRLPAGERWSAVPVALTGGARAAPLVLPGVPSPVYGIAEADPSTGEPREAVAWNVRGDIAVPDERDQERDQERPRGREEAGAAFVAIGAGGGAAGMFGSRSGGGRKRAVARGGGTKASESAVEGNLRWLKERQSPDGSFNEGIRPSATTALTALAILGAGYDHKTPNRLKPVIAKTIAWLIDQDLAQAPLVELSLGACALAEAYAMTSDAALAGRTQQAIDALVRRIAAGELGQAMAGDGPLAGPEVVAYASMALKSAQAGNLQVGDAMQAMIPRLPTLGLGRDRVEGRIAQLAALTWLGQRPAISLDEIDGWINQVPRWIDQGRQELGWLATHAVFQNGGEGWKRWNAVWRDQMTARDPLAITYPGGAFAGTALAVLSLEIYYRYALTGKIVENSVRDKDSESDQRLTGPPPAAPDFAGWPVRWTVPALAYANDDERQRSVALDPVAIVGRVERVCIPVLDTVAWRRMPVANPLAQALPGADVLVDVGDARTTARWPFLAPWGKASIDLGRDEAVRVERVAEAISDEGWIKRELTVTLRFTCHAPAGTDPVQVVEPLPQTTTDLPIACTIVEPALPPKEEERLRRDDPYLRFTLAPGATKSVVYRMRYSTDVKPALEFLP